MSQKPRFLANDLLHFRLQNESEDIFLVGIVPFSTIQPVASQARLYALGRPDYYRGRALADNFIAHSLWTMTLASSSLPLNV